MAKRDAFRGCGDELMLVLLTWVGAEVTITEGMELVKRGLRWGLGHALNRNRTALLGVADSEFRVIREMETVRQSYSLFSSDHTEH